MKLFFITWIIATLISVGTSILAKTIVWQLQYGVQAIPDIISVLLATLFITIGICVYKKLK